MEDFRYGMGVFLVFILPIVVVFWLTIHGGIRFWRGRSPGLAYLIAGGMIVLVVMICWFMLETLLGKNLGINWLVFWIGLATYLASFILWRPVKRYLDFRTFSGLPEVQGEEIELITGGPFSIVRHPRYLMVAVGILGWSMMSHYSGVYWVAAASILGLLAVIRLEERELVSRFGQSYRNYQSSTPAIFPNFQGIRKFFREFRDW